MGFDGIGISEERIKKEFNPTKKDLLMIENLILDIKSKKSALIKRKIDIQNALSYHKNEYKHVEYNSTGFMRIKNARQNLKDCFNKIELELKELNDELNFKSRLRGEIEFHLAHNKSLEGKEDLDKLISKIHFLKVKYSNFTKDRTRIASLRVMASEIFDELDNLLK